MSFDAALETTTDSRFVNPSPLDPDAAPNLIGNGVISDSDGATSSSAARNILEESIQEYKVIHRFNAIQIRQLRKCGTRQVKDLTEKGIL